MDWTVRVELAELLLAHVEQHIVHEQCLDLDEILHLRQQATVVSLGKCHRRIGVR